MKRLKLLLIIFLSFICMNNVYADSNDNIEYSSHVSFIGWQDYVKGNQTTGTTGESKRLEAIKINLKNVEGSIMYKVHVQDIGWMDYVKNNELSGTTGQSKRLEAIQIKLTGRASELYDIYYRTHVQDIGWMPWVKNDEMSGTSGQSKRMEAMEIKLVEKPQSQNIDNTISLNYKSYIKDIGWQNTVGDNEISGTVGESKSIEQINISIQNKTNYKGSILYSVYTSNSWQDYKTSDENIGINGKNIEALKIKLTDDLEKNYDIYYRTHVSNVGWLSWTKNDGISGTIGYFENIEAIQITLVRKGDSTPEVENDSYRESKNTISYSSHVSNVGWMNYVNDGETSGTTGQSRAIEALKIKLDSSINSSIVYKTYVRNVGWQDYKGNDEITGTTGETKSIEAIQIKLEGKLSEYYDIYYRTHVSNIGWMPWAKNDGKAGSVGNNTNIEAIEIKLVLKTDNNKPSTEGNAYVTGHWDGNSYIDVFGRKVTGFRFIDGIKYYFNNEGTMIGKNVKKVIDVSSWQNRIDWNTVKAKGEIDAAILRVGWGMSYYDPAGTDSYFDYNVKECQRLGIPYNIYIYGYAKIEDAGKREAQFVIDKMKQYNIPKDTFVWYDAEESVIPLSTYDIVIPAFINHMHSNGYNNVGVYGSLNNFVTSYGNLNSPTIRSYPLWVAQYYKKIQYPDKYEGWQYTSDGSIEGINGRVDVSMFY